MPAPRPRRHSVVLLLLTVLLIAGGYWLYRDGLAILFPELLRTELTIRWTTENEIDVAGYNLYRAATADGEFIKVNSAPIPPATDPFVSTEHVFVDDVNVIRGQTYYYLLETIDRQGDSRREGPFAITAD